LVAGVAGPESSGVQVVVTVHSASRPGPSLLGIAWLAFTSVAMFGLALGKARTGAALGNATLSSEARVTVVDGLLAATVLAGLLANGAFGWWWVSRPGLLGGS
jgi:divalent metal cation (Fe/Co/Zn/Cd) transporter